MSKQLDKILDTLLLGGTYCKDIDGNFVPVKWEGSPLLAKSKADLLAWHREEVLRIIGEDDDREELDGRISARIRNMLRDDQRERLRASLASPLEVE